MSHLKEVVSKFLEAEPYSIIWIAYQTSTRGTRAKLVATTGKFSCSCGATLVENTIRTDPIADEIVHKFLIHVAKVHMGHV